ncbi:flippase [Priestia megaterium]|uniref:flippase n=1 Tax=Priestia megaterium TaxID=1404 RepID=UPI001B3A3F25|nr:flippase [Priestia megaterium]MBQ4867333.1 flippase [Priestia megaterium]
MRVINNYLYNLTYQILAMVLPIITIPYVSRVLGPNGLGSYALTNAYAQYFVLFGMVGLSIYSSREVAYVRDDKDELNRTFWELNFIRIVTVGVSFIIYIIVFGFFLDSSYKVVYIIQSLIILSSLVDISWLFIGLENFKSVVIKNTLVKVIGVILIFIFVKDDSDLWLYTLILGAAQLVGQVLMWAELPRHIRFVFPNLESSIRHLKYSVKLFIPQIAINVYAMLDKIMLGILVNESQVGLYDNSQKIIKLLITVVTAFAAVTVPKMANLYKNMHYKEFENTIYKSFSFVSFLAFPMTFGLIGITKSFVPWFYGSEFAGIIPMFYIGSFLMITLSWTSILGNQVLITLKREREFTIAVVWGAIINIILNFILIKKFGGVGTTISTVMAEYTGMVIMLYFLRDIINVKRLFKPVGKYVVSSLLMFCIIWLMSSNMQPTIVNSILIVFTGGIVYLVMMILTKDENIIYALNLLISKKKRENSI